MQINAVALGSSVAFIRETEFIGVVHSVFQSVLNLDVNTRLVSVVGGKSFRLPNEVSVVTSADFSFLRSGLKAGMTIYGDTRTIYIPEADTQFNLSAAAIFSSHRKITPPLCPAAERQKRMHAVKSECQRIAPACGLGFFWTVIDAIIDGSCCPKESWSLIGKAAHQPLQTLVQGIRGNCSEKIICAVRQLSGLGEGLTPSGDDILTGLVSSFSLLGGFYREYHFQKMNDIILENACGRSNPVAWTYLVHASKSEMSDPIFQFIDGIVGYPAPDIERIVNSLFSFGAASGSEAALGEYVGMRLLEENL